MPSKSKKQAKFMAAVANNPKFAKKAGVPQGVGQEFANADKRNKDMPSKFNSTANKPGKAVKKYRGGGRTAADTAANRKLPFHLGLMRAARKSGAHPFKTGGKVHDKKVLRNLDDEVYRIAPKEAMGGAEGRDARDERRRINKEKDYEKRHMAKGGKVKGQGYNDRLDESLGARNKTKGKQSLKSRRSESEGMEKASGKRKYSAVGTMDKGGAGKKKATAKKASNQATSPRTPQHKRMAMGENVVKKSGGGSIGSAPRGWGIAKRGWR
tara:strand:+ start:402 stop:1205 length:804 start_codon:yes stop_codon:yes gene_type:complete